MLGGTSKQERALIRSRVRDGMTVLARDGNRHLGGRPPYGYLRSTPASTPTPRSAPSANAFTASSPTPSTRPPSTGSSPCSARDTASRRSPTLSRPTASRPLPPTTRSRHRDPRGWAHTAIRSILRNEKYLGRAVWGQQTRVEELYDLDDVAAGYATHQRRTADENWVYGPDDAHPALIGEELWKAAQARIAVRAQQAQGGVTTRR